MSTQDISDIKDSLARIETHIPALLDQAKDHEKRIRFLEKYAYLAIGAIILAQFGIELLLKK